MSSWLSRDSFSSYPAQGRELALSHLSALREIPVSLLPVFLVDLKDYDWKFPVEQREVERRIEFIQADPSSVAAFRTINVGPSLDNPDKATNPQRFLAEMTAYLWSSLQMDAYRRAADSFVSHLDASAKPASPALPRLVMISIGRDAQAPAFPLFAKLRPYGQMHTNVRAEGSAQALLDTLHRRSAHHPQPYAHWYVDGGNPLSDSLGEGITPLFYPSLSAVNNQILARMMSCIKAGSGPEVLQTKLAELGQEAPSAGAFTSDPRLHHFAVSLLTEGSGTQIFSTSFVQWAMREILRRAQPATMLARFAPRQRQKPFNAMVAAAARATDSDPEGSLIDADMSAYYAYLEMKRLPNADQGRIVIWFEAHSQAFVAGFGAAKGTTSDAPTNMSDLLAES